MRGFALHPKIGESKEDGNDMGNQKDEKLQDKHQASQRAAMQQVLAKMQLAALPTLPILSTVKRVAPQKQASNASTWDASHNTAAAHSMSGRLSGHGMNVDAETYQKALKADAENGRRTGAGLKSMGYKWLGFLPATGETGVQAFENWWADRDNQPLINLKKERKSDWYGKAYHGHEMDLAGKTDEVWAQIRKLEDQIEKTRTKTPVDQSLPGQRSMALSRQYAQEATEGLSGFDKLIADAAISIGGDLPTALATGVNPIFGAIIGGLQAAGEKTSDLNARGVDPSESFLRGVVSGGINVASGTIPVEKLPVQKYLNLINHSGGESFVTDMLKASGVEDASKDVAAYMMNYLADLAAQDPNTKWSWSELLQSAAMSGLSGRVYDGAGTAIQGKQNVPTGSLNPYEYMPRQGRLPFLR